mmetsp:Transcript_54567/g.143684  ORF Transcript_54567/g.143684 Transcript_54567/m.143684 type:complete len:216 (-) Transcript_54567:204-851(-)
MVPPAFFAPRIPFFGFRPKSPPRVVLPSWGSISSSPTRAERPISGVDSLRRLIWLRPPVSGEESPPPRPRAWTLLVLRSSKPLKPPSTPVFSLTGFALQREGNTRMSSSPSVNLPGFLCILTTLCTPFSRRPSIWACDLLSPGTAVGCETVAFTSWCASWTSIAISTVSSSSSMQLSKRQKFVRPKAPETSKKFEQSLFCEPACSVVFRETPAGA